MQKISSYLPCLKKANKYTQYFRNSKIGQQNEGQGTPENKYFKKSIKEVVLFKITCIFVKKKRPFFLDNDFLEKIAPLHTFHLRSMYSGRNDGLYTTCSDLTVFPSDSYVQNNFFMKK